MADGEIHFPERKRQLVTWRGAKYGSITPTDIDGSVDYGHGRLFVFTDLKVDGYTTTGGQREHYEHLVNGLRAGGRAAYAVIVTHTVPVQDTIDVSSCTVASYYDGSGHGWTAVYPRQNWRQFVSHVQSITFGQPRTVR